MTTEAEKAYNRAYYLANREKIRARNTAWAKAHPEQCRAYKAAWDEKHPEDKRRHWREYQKRKRTKAILAELEGIQKRKRHRESLREFITRKAA